MLEVEKEKVLAAFDKIIAMEESPQYKDVMAAFGKKLNTIVEIQDETERNTALAAFGKILNTLVEIEDETDRNTALAELARAELAGEKNTDADD